MRAAVCLLAAALVAGCDDTPPKPTAAPAFTSAPLEAVFRRVKQEIGLFNYDDQQTRNDWAAYLRRMQAEGGCAGATPLHFQVSAIRMTFNIVRTNQVSADGKVSLSLPYVVSGIDAGASHDRTTTDAQELTYVYYPGDTPYLDAGFDRQGAIILNDLDALRDGIVRAGTAKPCFRNTPAGTGQDTSLTFGITLERDDKVEGAVKFLPAALSIGASGESKATSGNTIVVTFKVVNG
jgi:hypothetical protein